MGNVFSQRALWHRVLPVSYEAVPVLAGNERAPTSGRMWKQKSLSFPLRGAGMADGCRDKMELLMCEAGQLEALFCLNLWGLTKPPSWGIGGESVMVQCAIGMLKIPKYSSFVPCFRSKSSLSSVKREVRMPRISGQSPENLLAKSPYSHSHLSGFYGTPSNAFSENWDKNTISY